MKRQKMIVLLMMIVLLGLVASPSAVAQQMGTLKGHIVDPAATGIPWAKVTVTKEAKKYESTVQPDGTYALALPEGIYRLVGRAAGFLPSKPRPIHVRADQTIEANITLFVTRETQGDGRQDAGCIPPTPDAGRHGTGDGFRLGLRATCP